MNSNVAYDSFRRAFGTCVRMKDILPPHRLHPTRLDSTVQETEDDWTDQEKEMLNRLKNQKKINLFEDSWGEWVVDPALASTSGVNEGSGSDPEKVKKVIADLAGKSTKEVTAEAPAAAKAEKKEEKKESESEDDDMGLRLLFV